MKPVLTADQVRNLDRIAIDIAGVPGPVLMEKAGELSVLELLERHSTDLKNGILVLCGRGNNGGDGYVIARKLCLAGYKAKILELPGKRSEDADINRAICINMGLEFLDTWPDSGFGLIVDALLGTGLNSNLRGIVADWVEKVNNLNLPVLAVDIPTGLCADTGRVMGVAVKATFTVTFGELKVGLVMGSGPEYCGDVVVADIGLNVVNYVKHNKDIGPFLNILEKSDVARWLPVRPKNAYKGTFGHLAVFAGTEQKAGAAILASNAAIRSGAGLVTLFIERVAWPRLAQLRPEVMIDEPGNFVPEKFTALAVGPGLGQSEIARDLFYNCDLPSVFDADGLNSLGCMPKRSSFKRVITPHVGEAARLLGLTNQEVMSDRITTIKKLSEIGIAVLKGPNTLIGDGRDIVLNPTGSEKLATAGSGDVLTGIIGSLLAQGLEPFKAACVGVSVHGICGQKSHILIASDLIKSIPMVHKTLKKQYCKRQIKR